MSEGVGAKFCPKIVLPQSSQNTSFFSFLDRKACTFLDLKRHLPLSVNTFRINQQALFRGDSQITPTDFLPKNWV
ncbi:MAG: hypothetical protein F6K54_18560 [Okeania sp. SIO3B5]|uniref:hypothetical protein n=1 Tax=Okeania sp. SIO3B5 TaxID=2607811 RepID=UPI001400F339|nr:hypothetical protein [Okeania sp. SIO3B5]NEO54902.1 hypothetical protein [Okeania sp. SIO3B5]